MPHQYHSPLPTSVFHGTSKPTDWGEFNEVRLTDLPVAIGFLPCLQMRNDKKSFIANLVQARPVQISYGRPGRARRQQPKWAPNWAGQGAAETNPYKTIRGRKKFM